MKNNGINMNTSTAAKVKHANRITSTIISAKGILAVIVLMSVFILISYLLS